MSLGNNELHPSDCKLSDNAIRVDDSRVWVLLLYAFPADVLILHGVLLRNDKHWLLYNDVCHLSASGLRSLIRNSAPSYNYGNGLL